MILGAKYKLEKYNVPGIVFTPVATNLTMYNGGNGCLGSNYSGSNAKIYAAPLTIPNKSRPDKIYINYYNKVENPTADIDIYVWRNYYCNGTTEL